MSLQNPTPLHSYHCLSDRHGVTYGKVYIMRRGQIPRNNQGQPIAFGPESVTRGDIILDLNLQPLRPRKGNRNGRR